MTEKYYLDSCIWMDYFEGCSDRFRPLGEWAFRLIRKIIEEEGIFVISDHLIEELMVHYSAHELSELLEIVPKQQILAVKIKEQHLLEALRVRDRLNLPLNDISHALLARDSCAIFVSRDKHFHGLQKIVAVKKPEELI